MIPSPVIADNVSCNQRPIIQRPIINTTSIPVPGFIARDIVIAYFRDHSLEGTDPTREILRTIIGNCISLNQREPRIECVRTTPNPSTILSKAILCNDVSSNGWLSLYDQYATRTMGNRESFKDRLSTLAIPKLNNEPTAQASSINKSLLRTIRTANNDVSSPKQ